MLLETGQIVGTSQLPTRPAHRLAVVIVNFMYGSSINGITPNQILSLTEGGVFTGTQHNSNKPIALDMQPNYPNPFSEKTYIPFHIPKPAHVQLVISDQLNREMAVLVDQNLPSGTHTICWETAGFEAGIYFCRFLMENDMVVQKLILID